MNILEKFEDKLEGAVEGAAGTVFSGPIEPAQIAKRAEKQMRREKLVGSGKQFAPTLYNVLVNPSDDRRLFGFYPTMAAEIENYIYARGIEAGLEFDIRPLVRFIADKDLKKGKFDVIAEVVAAPTILKLREEELEYYGLKPQPAAASEPGHSLLGEKDRPPLDGLDIPVDVRAIPDPAYSLALAPAPAPAALPAEPLAEPPDDELAKPLAALSPSPRPQKTVLGSAALYLLAERLQIVLAKPTLTIGRDQSSDIVLADASASRAHARLQQDATGRWKIIDLNSTNGILINGRQAQLALLRGGDEITIGTSLLRFDA